MAVEKPGKEEILAEVEKRKKLALALGCPQMINKKGKPLLSCKLINAACGSPVYLGGSVCLSCAKFSPPFTLESPRVQELIVRNMVGIIFRIWKQIDPKELVTEISRRIRVVKEFGDSSKAGDVLVQLAREGFPVKVATRVVARELPELL